MWQTPHMFCINMKHIIRHASPLKRKKTPSDVAEAVVCHWKYIICLHDDGLVHVCHLPNGNYRHVKLKCHSVKAKVTTVCSIFVYQVSRSIKLKYQGEKHYSGVMETAQITRGCNSAARRRCREVIQKRVCLFSLETNKQTADYSSILPIKHWVGWRYYSRH